MHAMGGGGGGGGGGQQPYFKEAGQRNSIEALIDHKLTIQASWSLKGLMITFQLQGQGQGEQI